MFSECNSDIHFGMCFACWPQPSLLAELPIILSQTCWNFVYIQITVWSYISEYLLKYDIWLFVEIRISSITVFISSRFFAASLYFKYLGITVWACLVIIRTSNTCVLYIRVYIMHKNWCIFYTDLKVLELFHMFPKFWKVLCHLGSSY